MLTSPVFFFYFIPFFSRLYFSQPPCPLSPPPFLLLSVLTVRQPIAISRVSSSVRSSTDGNHHHAGAATTTQPPFPLRPPSNSAQRTHRHCPSLACCVFSELSQGMSGLCLMSCPSPVFFFSPPPPILHSIFSYAVTFHYSKPCFSLHVFLS